MKSPVSALRDLRERRRLNRVQLPWDELEAEAERQGCSPADIFFDRAGRTVRDASTMPPRRERGPVPGETLGEHRPGHAPASRRPG